MERAIVKKAMGSPMGRGIEVKGDEHPETGEQKTARKDLRLVDVIGAFDPDFELTGFCADLAKDDCNGQYELLEIFLEWKDKTGLGNEEFDEFKDINVDILSEVTTPFLNAGFAIGYLFGQMFKTTDEEGNALLAELKKALTQKDLMPFTPQWRERVSPSISFTK